jgi:Holliday junction resolvase RusA-like endonuclease
MIQIVIDGFAQAQRSPQGVIVPPLPPTMRRRHSVRMYTPAEVRTWQTTARVLAAEKMRGQNPLGGALEVIIWVYLVPPSSLSLKKRALSLDGRLRPVTRPDCDNYAKAVLDALNGIVWLDDSQIVALHVYKFYAEKPRVQVKIDQLSSVVTLTRVPVDQAGFKWEGQK